MNRFVAFAERIQAWNNPLYVFDQRGADLGGMIQTACIVGIIVISFVKPWGKRVIKAKAASEG